jgi:ferredoxin-NADP reductase
MIEESAVSSTPMSWQTGTVVAIHNLTPRIKRFTLALQTSFSFQAGQHVDLRLTAENGYSAVRSYSIASSPTGSQEIELAIERLDNGEISPFFHDVVAVGDEIELRGPIGGHFVWKPSDGGPLLLIGGGAGVVPLMAMVRQRQQGAGNVPITLLLSSRTWDETPYRDELLAHHRAGNGFTLILTLTRGTARRMGDYSHRINHGMIAEILERSQTMPKLVFICGANAFVNTAADSILASKISSDSIRTERYGA